MGKLNDMAGQEFGCWKIHDLAPRQEGGAGDTRIQWNIECLICGNRFIKTARAITRKRNFPENCDKCPQPKKAKAKKPYPRNVNGFAVRPNELL